MKSILIDVEVFAALWRARQSPERDENEILARLLNVTPLAPPSLERPKASATVKSSRLTFKKEVMDKLDGEEIYECIFLEGIYQIKRKEFEEVFENVLNSKSYSVRGLYNYPTTPKKATRFKVA